jgi:translation initiation factor 2 beta subunit (eIF-2beta)/eIF-5
MFTFCPFCRSSKTRLVHLSGADHHGWAVECHACGAHGPIVSRQSEAWKRWNGLRWARRTLHMVSGS